MAEKGENYEYYKGAAIRSYVFNYDRRNSTYFFLYSRSCLMAVNYLDRVSGLFEFVNRNRSTTERAYPFRLNEMLK